MGIWVNALRLLAKLGRLKMTVFSAVTYAAGASLAAPVQFDTGLFFAGWAFVFFTQLVAHFLGEYYDLASDKLNCYGGALTGGSKVLVSGHVTPRQCFALGYACLATAATILLCVLPPRCLPIGCVLLLIGHQYSAPPFKSNHRGLGELTASAASNVFLPQFAALVQSASFEAPLGSLMFHSSLAMLVVPAFFLKVGLFLTLNMADRRPDWLGGKYTVAVLLGDEATGRLFGVCTVLAYVSAICIFLVGLGTATALAAILASAPEALSIARALNPVPTLPRLLGGKTVPQEARSRSEKERRPYRLDGLVVRVLKHAPCAVIAVFADTVLREVMAAGAAAAAEAATAGSTSGYWSGLFILLSRTGKMLLSGSLPARCVPVIPFIYLFFVRGPPPPPPSAKNSPESAAAAATPAERPGVIVAGGGVGGLVLGACLEQLGLPFQILEKCQPGHDDGGADLALWPAATKVLKELGVGSTESADGEFVDVLDFWGQKTYPVRVVRICKVDETASSSPGEHLGGVGTPDREGDDSALAAAPDITLTKVDMDAVVKGEGDPFRLVGRQAIMSALLPLVEKGNIRRGVRVTRAEQSLPPAAPAATAHVVAGTAGSDDGPAPPIERLACRVLVGADGIHSVCRLEVSANAAAVSALGHEVGGGDPAAASEGVAVTATRSAGPRDGGEVCYRGVLDLGEGSAAEAAGMRAMFEQDEEKRPSSMSVVYGDRIRFSWGFLDGARQTGYWFVKQLTEKKSGDASDGGGDDHDEARGELRLGSDWPEPLRTFARMTGEECSYAHRIQDRPPLDRWSSGNITLLGDACHPATPNNGQGACMAIEDALVLATLLGEYWEHPDGHIEAFYLYERARLAHTRSVQRESLKQMKLGQLTSRLGIWARELAIGAIPPSVLQKKLRAANVFDIDTWLDRFRALKAERRHLGQGGR